LAIIEHSSMLLSSNNLYNKFGNKLWWQWETNMRENVYREKKVKNLRCKNCLYILWVKFSQDYFPLNCNRSSFMVWLRSFEQEYSLQVATSFLGSWV
jgi:hypothetical protein